MKHAEASWMSRRRSGGTGRRARFRTWFPFREWRFESSLRHCKQGKDLRQEWVLALSLCTRPSGNFWYRSGPHVEGSMAAFRRTIRALHVGLTAIMTLVAGVPRFCCACPGEGSTPSTPKSAPRSAGCCCCCGGDCSGAAGSKSACCSREAPPSDPEESSPAIQPDRPWTHGSESSSTQRRPAKCRVAELPRPEAALPSWSDSASDEGRPSNVALPAQVDPAHALPGAAAGPRLWRPHTLPPPTDLVTLLQHLLI